MRTARSITYRVGARGAMLLVLSALWVRLFVWPLLAGHAATADVFYYTWPIELRLGLWAATITAAVVAAFVPPRKDWFGWVALVIMPMQRLSAWAISWVEAQIPGGDPGDPRAAAMVVLYGLLVLAVLVAAAMRPPMLEPRTD